MRNETADGLKALALLGVFMVNALGYALAPHYPMQLGAPHPVDSLFAQTIHALVLTLFMGKALPFLVFLFGYSMANFAKRTNHTHTLKRHLYKLLLIGVLHGTWVYFGDILTSYALVGLWLSGAINLRGRRLITQLRWWLLLALALLLYRLFLEWQHFQPLLAQDPTIALTTLVQADSYRSFLSANASTYFAYLLGWLLSYYAPLHIALFITGVLAARYQWLSQQPRAAHLFFRPWLYRSWPTALLANAILGFASASMHSQYGLAANVYWITVLNVPLGVWLVASSLTRFMLHLQTQKMTPQWLLWLAPAGRHTLAMYLGLSLTLMLIGCLGGFRTDAAWNHSVVLFLALLAAWLGAVVLSRAAKPVQIKALT